MNAIKIYEDAVRKLEKSKITLGEFEQIIAPLRNVIQTKRGKWKYHSNPTIGVNLESAYCSCCGFYVDTTGNIDFDEYNFCPRCGAKMEE